MSKNEKITLFLHHFEEDWEEGLSKFGLTSASYSDRIIDFLSTDVGQRINNVIITKWEDDRLENAHANLISFLEKRGCDYQVNILPYSLYEDCFSELDKDSLVAYQKEGEECALKIEPWQLSLRDHKDVYLAGAFDGECIIEASVVLDFVRGKDKWHRVEGLIVGSGHEYACSVTVDDCIHLVERWYGEEECHRDTEYGNLDYPRPIVKTKKEQQIISQVYVRNDLIDRLQEIPNLNVAEHFFGFSKNYVPAKSRHNHKFDSIEP